MAVNESSERRIVETSRAVPTSDGAGVSLYRSIGTREVDHVDPFLLLDEFRSDDANDYIRGFPDHPHRGFETVTYMLAGAMAHADSAGNRGELRTGDIQWMTAGRGIIHSEMPRQEDGLMWGFQLWVNLPASAKMIAPRYQDIPAARVPIVRTEGASVRVLAGSYGGETGPVEGVITEPLYLDVELEAGRSREFELPTDHSAFIYVFEGRARIGNPDPDVDEHGEADSKSRALETRTLGVLSTGSSVTATALDGPARFLLLAAQPLREPIARYGPFVMNTRAELEQAFIDYRNGTLAR
jgi:redox-sensitive bicupin YhaK (pirin superfamily)